MDGFFYWYISTWNQSTAEEIVGQLDCRGLSIKHQHSGLCSMLTNGPESWGEQFFVTRQQLFGAIARPDETGVEFQFWLDRDTDVITQVAVLDRIVVLRFGLDGLTEDQLDRATSALTQVTLQHNGTCEGFVLDKLGLTEDEDWDNIVLGANVPVSAGPDMLGLRKDRVAAHPEIFLHTPERYGNILVFEWK